MTQLPSAARERYALGEATSPAFPHERSATLPRPRDPHPPPAPAPAPTPQLASIVVADPSTLKPGAMGVPGAIVNLTAPVTMDTFVQAVSTNPAALTVESLTVPVGQSSAPLLVTVIQESPPVEVSVTLGAQTLQATIVTSSIV